ncbi:MAG: hypothetical protein ACI9TV_002491 [Sulfurimonas sp.]|jgi:hypothetical protein|uniref:hypothetical protein n=1 Tax=Sulfurimonas sp. TaxID=2022749 RepID=UPI0039E6F103
MTEEEQYKAGQVMLIMEEMQDHVLERIHLNIFDKEALVHYANQINEALLRSGVSPSPDVIKQMVDDFYTAVEKKKNNGEF